MYLLITDTVNSTPVNGSGEFLIGCPTEITRIESIFWPSEESLCEEDEVRKLADMIAYTRE